MVKSSFIRRKKEKVAEVENDGEEIDNNGAGVQQALDAGVAGALAATFGLPCASTGGISFDEEGRISLLPNPFLSSHATARKPREELDIGTDPSPYFLKDPKTGAYLGLKMENIVDKASSRMNSSSRRRSSDAAAAATAAAAAAAAGPYGSSVAVGMFNRNKMKAPKGAARDLDGLADNSALYRDAEEAQRAAVAADAGAVAVASRRHRGRQQQQQQQQQQQKQKESGGGKGGGGVVHVQQGGPTSGRDHFDLPSTPMTEALRQDLRAVRMRAALDPSRFYKSHDHNPSRFVQVGTVVEGREEFATARLSKKQRRPNLVEEMMADERARNYAKRKYSAIQGDKQGKQQRFGQRKKPTKHITKQHM